MKVFCFIYDYTDEAILKKFDVKDVDRSGFPWKFFLMKCTWVLCACVIIYLIFMVLNL
ncbi:hypothetical protein GCM10008916_05070 [Clostridium nitritogenes]|uniref:Uncharacterized protein n=1 Tax=Clostridium nitritogenes TaxID=83340 RepID=A0ABP3WW55_9CLOT